MKKQMSCDTYTNFDQDDKINQLILLLSNKAIIHLQHNLTL